MVKVLMNAVIGLIVSVYVLMTKEKFIGQSKRLYMPFSNRCGAM